MASELELLQDIKELLKNSNRSGSSSYSSPSSSSGNNNASGLLSGLAGAAGDATTGLKKVWEGSTSVADGFNLITGSLQRNGGALGNAIGKLTENFGNAILDVNKANKKAAEYGAEQGNNLGEFDKAVKGARMSHEEYGDMLRDATKEMAGAGSTASKAQKNFLDVAKGFQESNVGTRLKELGVSTEELNRITEASMAYNKGRDMSDNKAKADAVESAIRMAAAMDENTRISGLTRRAQEDDLKKRSEDAATQMALSKLDPEAKKRYDAAMADMANMPDAFKKAFTEQFTGGIRTSEGSATIAAMGDAGPALLKAAESIKDANSPEAREASQKQLTGAIGEFTRVQNTDSYKDLGIVGTGAAADASRALWTGNLERDKINAKIDEEKNKGNTVDEATARKMILEEVRNQQKNLKEDGTPNKDGALGQTINKADSALKDLSAGASVAFKDLVDKTNNLIGSESKLNDILKARTQDEATPDKIGTQIGQAILKQLPFDAGKLTDAYSKRHTEFQESNKDREELPSAAPKRSTGSPSFENFLSGSGGIKDMFESFNPNGELVELHGKELVANEAQMNKLFSQISKEMQPSTQPSSASASDASALNFEDVKNTVATQTNASSPQMSEITKTFTAVNAGMKDVTKQLGEVADKLKNINFEPALKNLSEHTTKVMEQVVKPTETKKEEPKPVETKKEEPKKEEVKSAETKKEEPKKEEVKPAETKPVEDKFAALSKTIESVTNEIQSGGIRTKEGAEKMASLGPAGVDLEKAIKAHKDATTDQQKADAINAENTAIAKIKDYQQSKTFIEQQQQHAIISAKAGFKDIDPIKSTEELNKKLFGALKVDGVEKKEPPKEQPKAPEKVEEKKEEKGFFDTVSDAFGKVGSSITGLFKDDKPAFAKGNVKYETIPQEEIDAANKRAQEGIGKVDNSPEAIAAQKAELERQKESGRYKEKEPEKPKTDDLKKPVETKEDAHVKEMYKKFGLESFKDFNARMDAESKPATPALKPNEVKKDETTKLSDNTNVKPLINPEEIIKKITDKSQHPDLSKPFANISDQLSGALNTKVPMLSHEEIFSKAQAMFKTPEMSNMFGSASETMTKMFEENKMFPAADTLKNESNAVADSINGLKLPTDATAPEEKTEDKGFFDTISDTFSKAGSSISDFFKDDKPAVSMDDIKSNPDNETPEEKAKLSAALKNLDKGAQTRADAEAEKAKLKDTKATVKEPEKPVVPAVTKPKSKEDEHVDAMYKKFGIERFDDFNARKSAEVKSAHAQIKDVSTDRAGITAQDVTPPTPVEQPKPVEHPKPAEPLVQQAPVAKEITLKDLHEALMQLNKTMGQMAQHTDSISSNSRKQVQATQSLSGNRYA